MRKETPQKMNIVENIIYTILEFMYFFGIHLFMTFSGDKNFYSANQSIIKVGLF